MKPAQENKPEIFSIVNNKTISPVNYQKLIIQIDNKRGFILTISNDHDSIQLLAYSYDENGKWSEQECLQFNLLPYCGNLLQLKLSTLKTEEAIQINKEIFSKLWVLREQAS